MREKPFWRFAGSGAQKADLVEEVLKAGWERS